MKRLFVTLVFTLFMAALPAWAEVIITESTDYYPVDGIGKEAILEHLKKSAPLKRDAKVHPSYTASDFRLKFTSGKRDGTCRVGKATITLTITYVYPKLAQPQSQAVTDWWNKQLVRYNIHELVHGDISKRHAALIDAELNAMRDLDCATREQIVKDRFQFLIRQMKQEQQAYDRLTEGGNKQYKYQQ